MLSYAQSVTPNTVLHALELSFDAILHHKLYAQMLRSLGFYLQYDLTFQFSSTLLHVRLVDGSYFKHDYHCFLSVQR